MTTLTKQALLDSTKPRFVWADINGIGRVGIRSVTELQRSRRMAALFDSDGKLLPEARIMRRVHTLIDQLMVDEQTPMFTEADAKELATCDAELLDPYLAAIKQINGDDQKKETAE